VQHNVGIRKVYNRASQPGPGGSPREELKIEGDEIYLKEEFGRKKLKNKHSRVLCKINAK